MTIEIEIGIKKANNCSTLKLRLYRIDTSADSLKIENAMLNSKN